jgi:hypothetical protein
MLHPRT